MLASENEACPGGPQAQCGQPGKGGECPTLCSEPGHLHPECWGVLQCKKDLSECVQDNEVGARASTPQGQDF